MESEIGVSAGDPANRAASAPAMSPFAVTKASLWSIFQPDRLKRGDSVRNLDCPTERRFTALLAYVGPRTRRMPIAYEAEILRNG